MLHHGMSVCASHNTVVDASTQRSTTRGSFTVTGGESSSPVSNGAFAGVVAKAKEEASRGNKLVTHKFETQDPPKRRRSSRSSRFSAPAPIIDLPEDDEEDVEEEAPRCIILPDSTFRAQTPAIAHSRLRSHCIAPRACASRARARRPPAHPPNHHAAWS